MRRYNVRHSRNKIEDLNKIASTLTISALVIAVCSKICGRFIDKTIYFHFEHFYSNDIKVHWKEMLEAYICEELFNKEVKSK